MIVVLKGSFLNITFVLIRIISLTGKVDGIWKGVASYEIGI